MIDLSYDIIGCIAILKFEGRKPLKQKKKIAEKLLRQRKNISTVLEKTDKVSGRLRTIKIRYLAGEKTTETVHIESGCKFKLDVEKCYFSPRLSNERLEIAEKIKRKDKVLVMFAGVGPFSIVIAKKSKPKKIISVEINRIASKYAEENSAVNKIENLITIQGDVRKVLPKLKEKFDVIVMPRPQLKESFLNSAFKVSKKKTRIFYYDFGRDIGEILEKIYIESKKAKKKIRIERIKKAGEIAPYKFRWRVEFVVL